mmetsp:Transcript_30245/g.44179  ORF Transcript_30245/g.44179 Transcript_30245/m.44179 type:complete len:330 (+) Transcript_30245:151-1140(+)
MLPPVGQGGGGRRKGAEAHVYYGPQAVGWHMWLVWIALNSVLYWRYTSPARSLLPLGEKVRLGDDVVVWRSTDANVKVVVPRRADDSAESVWLLTAHNVLHTELVHVEAGYHVSLHPLRLSPLVQITRSSRVAGAVQVRISTHKKRLTTNTFVIVADNVECFLPRSPCANLAVIANKQSPWPGGLDTHEDQGFEHADGAVSFATNLTGVMFLAILTGFRDLNQGVGADSDSPADRLVAPTHCGTWVNIDQGWKRLARCVEWAACDLDQPSPNPGPLSEQAGQGGKGGTHQPTVPDACRRARCLCLSEPGDERGCLRTQGCTALQGRPAF